MLVSNEVFVVGGRWGGRVEYRLFEGFMIEIGKRD